MTLYATVRLVTILLLAISAFLFVVKILMAEYFRKRQNGYMEPKLAGWYSQHQVNNPLVAQDRQFMQWSNVITSTMWALITISILLAWVVLKMEHSHT